MKFISKLLLACLTGTVYLLGAAEPQAKAPITRAALFKNGYALIVREVSAAPGDSFLIDETVTPVHGTLWFAPGDGLSVSGVKRIGMEPNRNPFVDFSASYAGQLVTVTLRASGSAQPRVVTGTVMQPGKQEGEVAPRNSFFTIKGENGKLIAFPQNEIATIESAAINEKLPEEKRMLLVNRVGMSGKALGVSYLTAGLTWAPAYRIALGPNSILQLDQSATLINELEDLKDVELNLVSGFPNLKYLQVISPLATNMTIQQFLRQMGGGDFYPVARSNKFARDSYLQAAEAGAVSPLESSGQSEDIHFTSAGKITLPKGDVLYKTLATARTSYERLVEWEIPESAVQWGTNRNQSNQSSGELWDAVRFKNPLEAPLTAAPIEIVDGEKLLGQTSIEWVNPNEETLVRIAKAQTVFGIRSENESTEKGSAKISSFTTNGQQRKYREAIVDGEIRLHNFRSSGTKVIARLQFSGELISAEGNPESKLLERGIYNLNPRRELTWEIPLKAGEELTCRYQYKVLVQL